MKIHYELQSTLCEFFDPINSLWTEIWIPTYMANAYWLLSVNLSSNKLAPAGYVFQSLCQKLFAGYEWNTMMMFQCFTPYFKKTSLALIPKFLLTCVIDGFAQFINLSWQLIRRKWSRPFQQFLCHLSLLFFAMWKSVKWEWCISFPLILERNYHDLIDSWYDERKFYKYAKSVHTVHMVNFI